MRTRTTKRHQSHAATEAWTLVVRMNVPVEEAAQRLQLSPDRVRRLVLGVAKRRAAAY